MAGDPQAEVHVGRLGPLRRSAARLITGATLIIVAVFLGFAMGDLVMFLEDKRRAAARSLAGAR